MSTKQSTEHLDSTRKKIWEIDNQIKKLEEERKKIVESVTFKTTLRIAHWRRRFFFVYNHHNLLLLKEGADLEDMWRYVARISDMTDIGQFRDKLRKEFNMHWIGPKSERRTIPGISMDNLECPADHYFESREEGEAALDWIEAMILMKEMGDK